MNNLLHKKYTCPGCGFQSKSVYDFSPSIEIATGDFRIFHSYSGMRGPLYCNQCKRKHLINISQQKKLTQKNIDFLKLEIAKHAKK